MLGGRGATVVGTATTDAGAQSITAYLSQAQIRGNGARLDVRIAENVERLVAEIEQGPRRGVDTRQQRRHRGQSRDAH